MRCSELFGVGEKRANGEHSEDEKCSDGETDRAMKRSIVMMARHEDDPREQVLYAQRDIGSLSAKL